MVPAVLRNVTPCASAVKPVTNGSALGAAPAAPGGCGGGVARHAASVEQAAIRPSRVRSSLILRLGLRRCAPTWRTTALPGRRVRSTVPSAPTSTVGPSSRRRRRALRRRRGRRPGRPVVKVRCRAVAPRLMTTKPSAPRPKAIWFAPSSHQFVTMGADAVARRNPTRRATNGRRCSQSQPPVAAVGVRGQSGARRRRPGPCSRGVRGGRSSRPAGVARSNAKLDNSDGWPYGQASMNTVARS